MSKLSLEIQKVCTGVEMKTKVKTQTTKIDKVSKTNKNTVASFSQKTKAQILLRDRTCPLCSKPIQDFHHIYFWTQCEYWEDRNDVTKGIGLCRWCHEKCHASSQWKWKRQQAISYVEWYYNNWLKANIVIADEAL